jgi:hypothetical protein
VAFGEVLVPARDPLLHRLRMLLALALLLVLDLLLLALLLLLLLVEPAKLGGHRIRIGAA